jgi:DNA-binding NtrC family response regulator
MFQCRGSAGFLLSKNYLKIDEDAVVLMVTAYATFDTAVSAWEKGATGIVRKPFQNEQILNFVANGVKKRRKEEERQTLRQAMTRVCQTRCHHRAFDSNGKCFSSG